MANDTNPLSELWVAATGASLLGWVHLVIHVSLGSDPKLEIGGLVVGEGARSQGVGRSLMEHAEDWAKARKIRKVRLTSNVARHGAHRFYEAIGLSRTKTSYTFEKDLS